MTPWLVFFGGLFAFAVPTLMAAFWQMMFFSAPVSKEWAPLTATAMEGRHIYTSNGCVYCHSDYSRPQDTRSGLYYLYPRVSLPGDYTTTQESPNLFGSARIGPDLKNESGFHPDDWEYAHFWDARYVSPISIMARFSFLSDKELQDLTAYVQTRAGKSGILRAAGQFYAKKVFLLAGDGNMAQVTTEGVNSASFFDQVGKIIPDPVEASKMTLAELQRQNMGMKGSTIDPPSGTVDGMPYPDIANINMAERGYWLASDPLPVTTDNLMRGRQIFQQRCIGCHGSGGAASSLAARFMAPRPIDFTGPDDATSGNDTSPGVYYYRILRGWRGSSMENFGTRLSVDDIWRVVLFLKTIPSGGLIADKVVTPDMYLAWKPPSELMTYVKKHPIQDNKDFQGWVAGKEDPFLAEAARIWAGMNMQDSFNVPGYGEVSLQKAAADIKAIYDEVLNAGYQYYQESGGQPAVPRSLIDVPPAIDRELR